MSLPARKVEEKKEKINRVIMWEEDGKAKYSTRLFAGDMIIEEKASGTVSYFRPERNRRLLIDNNDKRCARPLSIFEIVCHLSAATGLSWVIIENNSRYTKIQFVNQNV